MASEIYISYQSNGNPKFLEFTCSTDIDINYRNEVTTTRVEQGFNVTDHVRNYPINATVSGVISNFKNYHLDYFLPPEDLIRELKLLWVNKTPFTLYLDDTLEAFDNCVFLDFMISKTSGSGESWNSRMSIQQIQVSTTSAVRDFAEQSDDVSEQHSGKTQQSDNGKESTSADSTLRLFTKTLTEGLKVAFTTLKEEDEGGN